MNDADKFRLFRAGTGTNECQDMIKELGCNQLLSQLNEKSTIMKWVKYLREHPEATNKLFIDSGAFSAHTKGKEVDVDAYIQFMNEIDDVVWVFAQVDKIPGRFGQPKTPQELADAPRESWENYLYMVDKVKSRDKLLPIFHQGEDFKWLHNMLNYKHADGKPIWYIGISPANDVSVSEKKKWLEVVFKIIKESPNPNVHTHAFGMTTISVLEQYPFTSADSTSWLLSAANGSIIVDGKTLPISDRRIHDNGNLLNRNPALKASVEEKAKKYGYTLEQLSEDPAARRLFNIQTLRDWEVNYTYRGVDLYKNLLW